MCFPAPKWSGNLLLEFQEEPQLCARLGLGSLMVLKDRMHPSHEIVRCAPYFDDPFALALCFIPSAPAPERRASGEESVHEARLVRIPRHEPHATGPIKLSFGPMLQRLNTKLRERVAQLWNHRKPHREQSNSHQTNLICQHQQSCIMC